MKETTYSGYWKHKTSCNLFESGHEINKDFIAVIKQVAENSKYDVEYASAGCGTCVTMLGEINLLWIAQGDAIDFVNINYDSGVIPRKDVAPMIVEAADKVGVKSEWDGNPQKCVKLISK